MIEQEKSYGCQIRRICSTKAGKTPNIGTPDQIAAKIQSIVDAGANYIIVYLPGLAYDQSMLRRFAETVIPRFQ